MRMRIIVSAAAAALMIGSVALTTSACSDRRHSRGPAERAGAKVDRAADKTGDAIERGAEKTGDAIEKGGRKVNRALPGD